MSCSVYFDNCHNNVYKAGDSIEGRIACRFTSNHEIRGKCGHHSSIIITCNSAEMQMTDAIEAHLEDFRKL